MTIRPDPQLDRAESWPRRLAGLLEPLLPDQIVLPAQGAIEDTIAQAVVALDKSASKLSPCAALAAFVTKQCGGVNAFWPVLAVRHSYVPVAILDIGLGLA